MADHYVPDRQPLGPRRIVVATRCNDPAASFVGTSWAVGDRGSLGIVLPPDPTTSQDQRYLVRLAATEVPQGRFRVSNLRQYLTLAAPFPPDQQPPAPIVPVELDVHRLGPHFKLPDANVSWHLTFQPRTRMQPVDRTGQIPGWSRVADDLNAAILYEALPASLGGPGYIPINAGKPPGEAVQPWGTFNDLRFPWTSLTGAAPTLGVVLEGPGTIAFWASVAQTNPESRPSPLPRDLFPATTLIDQFAQMAVYFIQSARYWRIAGELTVDVME